MGLSAYSTTPASNTTINGINIAEGCPPSGINDAIRQLMADLALDAMNKNGVNNLTAAFNEAKGANIASAATTDIGAATGNFVDVTGTVTITALGTVQAGTHRWVRFTGALTLTHNATSLILPGATNITTANGDIAEFISLGSGNWVCANYCTAAVTAYAPLASPTFSGVPAAPTPAPGTNTTQLATTAFVAASFAPLASPTFSGTPSLPTGTVGVTQAAGNNSTKLATTAYADAAVAAAPNPVKAWVNWTAGGTTINGSANVSSVTRAVAGDYTVNFTSALPSANYGVMGSTATTPGTAYLVNQHAGTAPTTTSCRILITQSWTGSIADPSSNKISVSFFN